VQCVVINGDGRCGWLKPTSIWCARQIIPPSACNHVSTEIISVNFTYLALAFGPEKHIYLLNHYLIYNGFHVSTDFIRCLILPISISLDISEQVVKVIWHKTASLPQTDGSIVFARWHQCAHMGGHIGTTWQIRLNLCFLRPTPVHNPNGKWIGSAVSAQLTAERPYTLQLATLSPKLPLLVRDLDHHLIHDSLSQTEPTNRTASLSVQVFSHRWPQSVPIFYNGTTLSPSKLPLPMGGPGPPSNKWFSGPTRVFNLNGISIASAVLAGLTNATDRQTTLLGR